MEECNTDHRNNLGLPPIGVLITAYNRQERLERTLKSLESELPLMHIVLVDDGSNPPISTKSFPTYPIHLIRLPTNRGPMAASNEGLRYIYARGYEFIARLDSDDVAINERFSKQLSFMRQNVDIGLLGSHFIIVSPEGKLLSHSQCPLDDSALRKAMRIGSMIHHPTLMIRTAVAQRAGFYDESFAASGDYDFIWRLMNITHVANHPDALIRYEKGAKDSISVRRRRIQTINALKVMVKHFDPLSAFSYLGLLVYLLSITDTLRYARGLRPLMLRLFFGRRWMLKPTEELVD